MKIQGVMKKKGVLLILSSLAFMISCVMQEYSEGQKEALGHIRAIYNHARITNITEATVLHEYDLLKDTDVIYRHSLYPNPCKAHVRRVEKALEKIQKDNIVFGEAYTIDFTYSGYDHRRRTAQKVIILRERECYILTDKDEIYDDCFEFLDKKYNLSEESLLERMKEATDDITSYLRGF